MAKPDKSPAYEYTVDSQWAGWWGGYGAERLLEKEINQRASEGWRLIRTEARPFWWWGVSIVPPFFSRDEPKFCTYSKGLSSPYATP